MSRLKGPLILLVVDMQNGFCHSSGSFSKIGLPTSRQAAIVPTIKKLAESCRAQGIPILYTKMEFNEDFSDAGIILDGLAGIKEEKALIRDTWDAQILDALHPRSDDFIISKTRHSAFFETALFQFLADKDIHQIILTGVGTNVCVESTARDAYTYGFLPITVEDATATLSQEGHDASIINLQNF